MLRKLKVAILDFARSDYLQSFGVKKNRFYYDEENNKEQEESQR